MRIAILDSWPNLPENAEREFIARFQIACANIGVDCSVVVTSDDISACDPAVVLVSHEFSRKLTGYPTVGMIWSPLSFFRDDPYRVRSLLSYDGYLVANDSIRLYLEDIQSGLSASKPIANGIFLPTSYQTEHHSLEQVQQPSVCYIGVHWDGARHRDLFDILARRELITCYGPEQSWRHLPGVYGGYLPFDGKAVVNTIAEHGLALCLHKAEHRLENTPSMRIFEALSVGALPICDDIAFARTNLSEFATFVDMTQSAGRVADQVEAVVDNVRRRPSEARELARKAKAWFDSNWSLEVKIKNVIVPLVDELRHVGKFAADRRSGPVHTCITGVAGPPEPACEVVMRSGGRDLTFVERAIGSVKAANSAEFSLGMLVVDYKHRRDLEEFCSSRAEPRFPIRYIQSPQTGFRSTALWDGLKAVRAPFVAHLDDDDTVFENHYRQLAAAFDYNTYSKVCYSGVIRVEDEEGYYVNAPNFDGPANLVIRERRELKFLDVFDLERLARFDNFIQSNAWMAKTAFVQNLLHDDPKLVVTEDVYLYLLMAAHGPFGFTGSPTALWHWRSRTNDNSMLAVDQDLWAECVERVKLRLTCIPFQSATTFDRLLNPPTGGEKQVAIQPRLESLPPLSFNQAVEGGLAFKAAAVLDGFYEPEIGGIWSKQTVATILMPLGNRVRKEGGMLVVECLAAMTDVEDRWIELSIIDGDERRVSVTDWSLKTIELPLLAGTSSPLVLKLRTSHLTAPGEGSKARRELGGFIQSIRVIAKSDVEMSVPRPSMLMGLPGAWSIPIQAGLARGTLETYQRVAVRVTTSVSGRLSLTDGQNTVSVAVSNIGEFLISARLAEASHRFVFQADDPEASGDMHLEFTDEAEQADWLVIVADGVATLRDYVSMNEGAYQHAAVSVTAGMLIKTGPKPLYFLVQHHNGAGWWETRPYYGPAWTLLYDHGTESVDERSRFRRGELTPLAETIAKLSLDEGALTATSSRDYVAVSIMRSVLVGAINALSLGKVEVPERFLAWLIGELCGPWERRVRDLES